MAQPITEAEIRAYLARHASFIDPTNELTPAHRTQLMDAYVREMKGWPRFMQSLAIHTGAPVAFLSERAWLSPANQDNQTADAFFSLRGNRALNIPGNGTAYRVTVDASGAHIKPGAVPHEAGHHLDRLLVMLEGAGKFRSEELPDDVKAAYANWLKDQMERRAHNNAFVVTQVKHPKTGVLTPIDQLTDGLRNLPQHLIGYHPDDRLSETVAEIATTHAALYRLSDHLPEPQRTQSVHAELSRAYGSDFYDKIYRPHFHDAAETLAARVERAVAQRVEMIKFAITIGEKVPAFEKAGGDPLVAARLQLMEAFSRLPDYEAFNREGLERMTAMQTGMTRYEQLAALQDKAAGRAVRSAESYREAAIAMVRSGGLEELEKANAELTVKYGVQLAERVPHLPLAHHPTVIKAALPVAKTGAKLLIPPLAGSLIAGVMLIPTKARAEQAFLDKKLTEDQLSEWYAIAGKAIAAEAPGVMISTAAGLAVGHEYAQWVARHNIPKELAEAINPTMVAAVSNSARFAEELTTGLQGAVHVPSVDALVKASERLALAAAELARARAESARELPGALPTLQVHESAAARAVRQAAEREMAEATRVSLSAMEAMLADPAARAAMKVSLTRAAAVSLPTEPRESYPDSLNAAILARNELLAIRSEAAREGERIRDRIGVAGIQNHEPAAIRARRLSAERKFWAAVEVVASDGTLYQFSQDRVPAVKPEVARVEPAPEIRLEAAQLAAAGIRAASQPIKLAESREPEENDLPPDLRKAPDAQSASVKQV